MKYTGKSLVDFNELKYIELIFIIIGAFINVKNKLSIVLCIFIQKVMDTSRDLNIVLIASFKYWNTPKILVGVDFAELKYFTFHLIAFLMHRILLINTIMQFIKYLNLSKFQ